MADRDNDSPPLNLNSQSLAFAEELYARYLEDPQSVGPRWREYFDRFEEDDPARLRPRPRPSFKPSSIFNPGGNGAGATGAPTGSARDAIIQHKVEQLVRGYRVRGHLIAHIDPLGLYQPDVPELNMSFYGISEDELDCCIIETPIFSPEKRLTVREVIERLRNTYCRSIAVQYMHIDDWSIKEWLMRRMESTQNRVVLSRDEQMRILTRLTDAVIFEDFVQKKFIGAKSFSLEGAESLIPLLDLAIEKAGEQGIGEIVMAMAHRGRLNVLANIMGKHPRQIFREFEDTDPEMHVGRGDVKYHLGYSSDWTTHAGKHIHLSLCFNPSHLEYVNPVALGRVRAKQDHFGDAARERCMPLLIHGDAAFIGEGVTQETLNLSQIEAYGVGGALHVVVNNQIGFTTSPEQGRSTPYATAVGKMLQSPIFHVNGEDPEAVAQVVNLAMEFRKRFKRDVIIDMYCYRRRGHNEGDEPAFTQPILYKAIAERKSVREGYMDHLVKLKEISREQADEIAERRRQHLEKELSAARNEELHHFCEVPRGLWSGYRGGDESGVREVMTGIVPERTQFLLERLTTLEEGFNLHRKLERGFQMRREMAKGERPIDWAAAEALAFASLATDGHRVRLTGQDSERGTFSQRHAVLHDVENGYTYMPLQFLTRDQAPVEIYNSPLSENGVLGYEYGYSLDCPDGLIAWEAQFGDFINAAQVIVDQFIASAEDKWHRLSGIVLLLPHGFEGQGPEHSSARLERFLLLAADYNMQVANPTTPAQYFHLLRRQVLRKWRKPLIVMTPKSLLRHPQCVSSINDLAAGGFQRIMPDANGIRGEVRRVLLCSGKIYYELAARREEMEQNDIAILRLEQLYPLYDEQLAEALEPYPEETPVFWVQEEPENMGAWRYLRVRFGERMIGKYPFHGITREESASPATGSHAAHEWEQHHLLYHAFCEEPMRKETVH